MNRVKDIVTGPQCLQRFNPELPTVLLTDASRTGLGYVLIQTEKKPEANDDDSLADVVTKHTAKKIPKGKLVSCGSRFLSSAEANYAVIELELLAIQWAISRSCLYLHCKFFGSKNCRFPLCSKSHCTFTAIIAVINY